MSQKYGIYLAIFISESSRSPIGEAGAKLYYQENFTLIKASSLEEAEQKAADNADLVKVSYENRYGETVTWVLKQIVTVQDVMLEEEIDLHSDAVDFFVRGFDDYEAYQFLHGVKRD